MSESVRPTLNVAIVLYEGVEILDFAGPAEVFAAAANEGADRGSPAFSVYTAARSRDPIVSQGFIDVLPDYAFADAPQPDIIVFPGGSSSVLTGDDTFMTWAQAAIANAKLTLTVCTGAMAAGKLGILEGLTVTTHHGSLVSLQKLVPSANVVSDQRFVDNDRIITTAGVSAGIDGALHAVARLLGRKVADDTAWYMEYSWTPDEKHAATYSYLDPSRDVNGQRMQQALIDAQTGEWAKAESALRAMLAEDGADGYTWSLLTETLRGQQRWSEALDAARRTKELDGYRIDGLYLEAAAQARLGQDEEAIAALQEAIAAGFNERWRFERDTDFDGLRSDTRFTAMQNA